MFLPILLAQAVTVLAAPFNSTLYSIDPAQRGSDLVNMFGQLSQVPYNTYQSEIALQTYEALIHNVKKFTVTPNNTILAVSFYPEGSRVLQTAVVFTENILQMVYSPYPIAGTSYIPQNTSKVIPYFPMNILQRGQDIQSMVTTLKNSSPTAEVILTTTLTGTYYETIPSGVIPNVQSVTVVLNKTVFNTLLLVAYNRPNAYVIVTPDQVLSINYTGPALQ